MNRVATSQERRATLTRRRFLQAGLVAGGLAGVAGGISTLYRAPVSPWDPSVRRGPVFGMLQAEPAQYAVLRAAGVDAVTVTVAWDRAEPDGPGLDDRYLREIDDRYRSARDSGLEVALSAGLNYPPSWVFELPGGTRFVDQTGQQWRGGVGGAVADAVFNPAVRGAQDAYLERLARRLEDHQPAGIRVGGLAWGELHYPPSHGIKPPNTFWAFGAAALSDSPVPGFRPGRGPQQDAAAFLDWYLSSLAGYGRWQLDTYRRHFGPQPRLLVLEPSWGMRPGDIPAAVGATLSGDSPGERRGTLTEGLDWERQLPLFAEVEGVSVCSTWVDAPDQGDDDERTSPARFLASLAERHGLGVWGENTGGNTVEDMRRCVDRVRDLRLEGLFWMSATSLGQPGAGLDDYARLIAQADR